MEVAKLVNNEKIFNTFINLYDRWQDECRYEDFNDYANAMAKVVEREMNCNVTNVVGKKRPFGIKFTEGDKRYELILRFKGRGYCCLAAGVVKG
jgi:hypothetical protein